MIRQISFAPSPQGMSLLAVLKARAHAHREAIDNNDDLCDVEAINDLQDDMADAAWTIIDEAFRAPLSAEGENGEPELELSKFPDPQGPLNLADLALVVLGLHMDGCQPNRKQLLALHGLLIGVLANAGIPRAAVDFQRLFDAAGGGHKTSAPCWRFLVPPEFRSSILAERELRLSL